jgi:hypothetical protein
MFELQLELLEKQISYIEDNADVKNAFETIVELLVGMGRRIEMLEDKPSENYEE